MLASAGAVHRQRACHQACIELFSGLYLGVVGGVNQHLNVEVAVAHMADDGRQHAGLLQVARGFVDAFGEL